MCRWVLTLDVSLFGGEEEHYKRVFKNKPSRALVASIINNLGYDEFIDTVLVGEHYVGIKEYCGIRFELYKEKLKQNKVQ